MCDKLYTINKKPRVCVVGAGIAGLSAARYLQESGINFTVIEATNYIGGTWRYDERVGTDENGIPLFTSMYKHLRTNLPKPAMELSGYPVPENMESFPSWKVYYDYILSYAKNFKLKRHIQFLREVTAISRINNSWNVKTRHVVSGERIEEECDYVFICTGHYSKPNYPHIKGENLFNGTIIHSHDYRVPDPFEGRRVLIVGAGPSAMDISLDIAEVSKTLIHSQHSKIVFNTPFPKHYIKKPDVKEFSANGVFFVDGTFEEIDDVVYCTGYQYHYPFLDETSGLTLSSQYVTPLHQYIVNINQPTMLMFGLIVRACVVSGIDAQVRYAVALVNGSFTLPSKSEMMKKWQVKLESLQAEGRPMSHLHLLAEKEDQYYADLTKESGIARVPPVLYKIRTSDTEAILDNLYTYRNYVYTVIDNNTFTRRYEPRRNSTGCIL